MDLHFFTALESGDGAGLFSGGEEGASTSLGSPQMYGVYGRSKVSFCVGKG